MPVKKTVKKTTIKKPVAKKVVAKSAIKTSIAKPTVFVETKKTNNSKCCVFNGSDWIIKLLIVILLLLNLILGAFNLFKKDSALKLEELKVGWAENLEKIIEQIWESDYYIEQQSMALEQTLVQMEMMNNPSWEEMNNLISEEDYAAMLEENNVETE